MLVCIISIILSACIGIASSFSTQKAPLSVYNIYDVYSRRSCTLSISTGSKNVFADIDSSRSESNSIASASASLKDKNDNNAAVIFTENGRDKDKGKDKVELDNHTSGSFDVAYGGCDDERLEAYNSRLRTSLGERWGGWFLGPVIRYMNNFIVGVLYTVILRVMNRFKAHNRDTLLKSVLHRDKSQGLLTVSNHQSFFDDPGLWAAVLPWWRMRPEQMRWTLIADNIFFRVCIEY